MKVSFLIVVLAAALVANLWASGASEKDTMMTPTPSMEKNDAMAPTMSPQAPLMDEKGFFSTQSLQPRVIPFTTEQAAQALAAKGTVVYAFLATWCPDCKATAADVEKNFGMLPSNFTLIYVNYDTQTTLKQKYGIVYQHSYVQIDASGKKLAAWSGTRTVDAIVKKTVAM